MLLGDALLVVHTAEDLVLLEVAGHRDAVIALILFNAFLYGRATAD